MPMEELKHVRDIRGVRVARPGGVAVSLSLTEAVELSVDWDDDEVGRHVEALAKAVLELQEQKAPVGLELVSLY